MVGAPHLGPLKDSLRNFESFQESIRNFDSWIGKCVPGAMDLDVLVERRDNFLVLEGKPWKNGVAISYGAHLSLSSLARRDGFTVYLVGEGRVDGETVLHYLDYAQAPRAAHISKYKGRMEAWWGPDCFERTDVEGLRRLVKGWWDAASAA